jgi:hypothetical protein
LNRRLPRATVGDGQNAANGLAAARGKKAALLRTSPLWLALVLLIGSLALARCSGGDEAATPPTATTEARDDAESAVTAAVTTSDAGSEQAAEGYAGTPRGSGILVADGDFEEGARGWAIGAYGGSAGTIARTTAESKLGNASLALSVTRPGDVAAAVPGQLVPAGTQHTLSAWVKSPPGTWNVLRVIEFGDGERLISDRVVSPTVAGDGTWKNVVGSFETDQGETRIEIRVMQGGTPATSYVDAVQLAFRHGHAPWSNQTLLSTIDGARIAVNGRIVTLDDATLTCGGEGPGIARDDDRVWTHFTCIQPTFPPGSLVGRDALFRVHVTGERAFAVTDTRLGR